MAKRGARLGPNVSLRCRGEGVPFVDTAGAGLNTVQIHRVTKAVRPRHRCVSVCQSTLLTAPNMSLIQIQRGGYGTLSQHENKLCSVNEKLSLLKMYQSLQKLGITLSRGVDPKERRFHATKKLYQAIIKLYIEIKTLNCLNW